MLFILPNMMLCNNIYNVNTIIHITNHIFLVPPLNSIMALPALFTFYVAWVIAMLLRPLFVFILACLLWNAPFTVLKLRMVADTFMYMFLCADKKFKKPSDRGGEED